MMNGFVLIDKPAGMTSFRITAAVRRKFGQKKAGHAGTLDPLATGVLPVFIGQATRLIDLIPDRKKQYLADFMLGITTDTLDNTGTVLTDQPFSHVTKQKLQEAIGAFTGEITQTPPMFSALKKDGVPLYKLARAGVDVERRARKTTIDKIELVAFDGMCGSLDVVCDKGTYIRTLIDDIGLYLHCGAIMTGLRRTASNGFSADQCVPLDVFLENPPETFLQPPDKALQDYPAVFVTPKQAVRFQNGGELDRTRLRLPVDAPIYRVYGGDTFLGLGEQTPAALKPRCVQHNS